MGYRIIVTGYPTELKQNFSTTNKLTLKDFINLALDTVYYNLNILV